MARAAELAGERPPGHQVRRIALGRSRIVL